MRELLLLLLLILSSCLGISTSVSTGPRPPLIEPTTLPAPEPLPRLARELLVVEDVEAFVLETYPMQIRLAVRGYWPSGCSGDVHTEQRLEGEALTVTIWRALPIDAVCPAVIVPYEETIAIEGSFTRLPTAITVNGWAAQKP